jgi:hypothetical protein
MNDTPEVSTAFRPKFDPPKLSAVGFVLEVLAGPDAGTRFRCNAGSIFPILIGQSSSCEFRVSDPSVSRRHLSLELEGSRLRIEDLRSRNGTLLNGASTQTAWLQGGEALVLGGTHVKVSLEETAEIAPLPLISSFGRTVGASAEMRRLYAMLSRLARSNIAVLIEGETGTGKEILAESIHEESPRANGPFVVFDCTSVAPNLIESELFGHERGAFTGATQTRVGVFEQANGGTLLIDEIGDLDRALQPKLLRVLERSELRRDATLIAKSRRGASETISIIALLLGVLNCLRCAVAAETSAFSCSTSFDSSAQTLAKSRPHKSPYGKMHRGPETFASSATLSRATLPLVIQSCLLQRSPSRSRATGAYLSTTFLAQLSSRTYPWSKRVGASWMRLNKCISQTFLRPTEVTSARRRRRRALPGDTFSVFVTAALRRPSVDVARDWPSKARNDRLERES